MLRRIALCLAAILSLTLSVTAWWMWDEVVAFERAHRILQNHGVRLAAIDAESPPGGPFRFSFTVNAQSYSGEFEASPEEAGFLHRVGLLGVAYSNRAPALFTPLASIPADSDPVRLARRTATVAGICLLLVGALGGLLCRWLGGR